jgi:uncharacterized protein YjbI with pentapeptide repeats
MRARLRSWWQKIGKLLITIVIVIVLLGLVRLTYTIIQINGTGLDKYDKVTTAIETTSSPLKKVTTTTVPQPGKTLWDWLGLLAILAIPVVVGLGAAWFTAQQGKVSDRENTDNQRETALQKYIDSMSELLLKEELSELTPEGKLKPENEKVRMIARLRTLTVLRRLDAERKGSVLEFLQESGLIERETSIITLDGANLRGANLKLIILNKTNLILAHLIGADLSYANLGGADLRGADLSRANLRGTDLRETNLSGAVLSRADLREANLSGADLSGTLPWGKTSEPSEKVSLRTFLNPNPNGANLIGATGTTPEQLAEAKSLRNATMPDGSIHP